MQWRVTIRVAGIDDDRTVFGRDVEFERDDRDAAHGFGMSEVGRLIDEIATEARTSKAVDE